MKKWSECIKRALRTFIEAAAAYLAAHIVLAVSTGGEDLSVMRTALMGLAVSSVAAGLAAVLNMPKKAAEAKDAAAGGGTAGAGLVEPDAAGGVSDAAIGAKESESAGGGQSAKSDLPDAEYGADKGATRTEPETEHDTGTAGLGGATRTVPEAEHDTGTADLGGATRTEPEAEHDTGTAGLGGATRTVPEADIADLSGEHGTAVGENMADGAGHKGIL